MTSLYLRRLEGWDILGAWGQGQWRRGQASGREYVGLGHTCLLPKWANWETANRHNTHCIHIEVLGLITPAELDQGHTDTRHASRGADTLPKPVLHHAKCTLVTIQKQGPCLAPYSPHTLPSQRVYLISLVFVRVLKIRCYHYPHFSGLETETKGLPLVLQLGSREARTGN